MDAGGISNYFRSTLASLTPSCLFIRRLWERGQESKGRKQLMDGFGHVSLGSKRLPTLLLLLWQNADNSTSLIEFKRLISFEHLIASRHGTL